MTTVKYEFTIYAEKTYSKNKLSKIVFGVRSRLCICSRLKSGPLLDVSDGCLLLFYATGNGYIGWTWQNAANEVSVIFDRLNLSFILSPAFRGRATGGGNSILH